VNFTQSFANASDWVEPGSLPAHVGQGPCTVEDVVADGVPVGEEGSDDGGPAAGMGHSAHAPGRTGARTGAGNGWLHA